MLANTAGPIDSNDDMKTLAQKTHSSKKPSQPSDREEAHSSRQVGELFNPYSELQIWQFIVAHPRLSQGAKLTYSLLAIHGGDDAQSFPSIKSLAAEIGGSERSVQNYIRELIQSTFISRDLTFQESGRQTSNSFRFIWNRYLRDAWLEYLKARDEKKNKKGRVNVTTPYPPTTNDSAPGRVQGLAPGRVNDTAPWRVQNSAPHINLQELKFEERSFEEGKAQGRASSQHYHQHAHVKQLVDDVGGGAAADDSLSQTLSSQNCKDPATHREDLRHLQALVKDTINPIGVARILAASAKRNFSLPQLASVFEKSGLDRAGGLIQFAESWEEGWEEISIARDKPKRPSCGVVTSPYEQKILAEAGYSKHGLYVGELQKLRDAVKAGARSWADYKALHGRLRLRGQPW